MKQTVKIPMTATRILRLAKASDAKKTQSDAIADLLREGLKNLATRETASPIAGV